MYRHVRILVADDSQDDRYFLKRAFVKAGINAPMGFVEDGVKAIEYLGGKGCYHDRSDFPLPNLMIMDLKMPLLDGFGVLKWLRAQPGLCQLPVLVLSSSGEPKDVDLAHELGANGYTIKPSNPGEMRGFVECVEVYWLKSHCYPSMRLRKGASV
jgi:CheY-like chemotaxis protein